MRVFTIAVFPAHPTQVQFIEYNGIVQGQEDCPFQDGTRVLPLLKGKGGQVRIITYPHTRAHPRGMDFSFFGSGAIATASAAVDSAAAATSTTGFGHQICKGSR